MQEPRSLEEMSEDQVLDFAGACAETAWLAEVDLLRVAYQWSVLHSADRLDPTQAGLPGREQARQASYARHVVSRTRDLQPEEAAYVDSAVAESADGRIPWSRFEALVEAKVAQAAPELAREKEERAARATFAMKRRSSTVDGAHGMGSFLVRADLATIEAIDAAVGARADRLAELAEAQSEIPPHLATEDRRRVHAFVLLVTGAADDADLADLLPEVTVFAHLRRPYLVDHTGTRRIPGTPRTAQHPESPRRPLVVELLHSPIGIEIDLEYPDVA